MNRILCRRAAVVLLVIALSACGNGDSASYVASAQKHLAKADYGAAIIELKNALKMTPNRADARFLLAQAFLASGNPAGAETEARKAVEFGYPADQALPLLLRALLLEGEYRKVVAEPLDRRVLSPAALADADTSRGLAYLALDDRAAARTALDSALAADPGYLQAKVARVRLAAADNDVAGALEQANAILAAAPNEVEVLILKADLQSAMGARDEGIKTLEQAVAVKPDNAQARWALVVALAADRKFAEAGSHLAEAKKLAPDDPRTWYTEALLAYMQGNMSTARQSVERAKYFAPDYVPAIYLSGLVDLRVGANAAAEGALRAVVAKVPNDDGARRALATAYVRRGKTSQALETLDPLLRRAPNDSSLLRATAEVYLASNDLAKAAEYFARANKLDSGNVPGRIRLAQVRFAMGETALAVKDLEALAAAEPEVPEPNLALISAYLQERDFDNALAAVAALEKKQPSSAVTYNVKGVVYMTRGDYKNARASFEKAVSLDPDFAAANFNLARLDIVDRNYDAARKRYQQLLAKEPDSEPAHLALARLLVTTNAPPGEVRAAIARAITANPMSDRPRLALIAYNGQLRDWRAAVDAAEKARAALPDNPRIVEALGTAQFAAGDTNQAIETFKRAVQMQPDSPAPLIRLAQVQDKIKDYDGSIASLRAAIERQPDLPGAWMAIAEVYADAGRFEAGIDDARRLQKQRADRAVGFAIEGELRARQKKWPESAAAYRLALARQPTPFIAVRLQSTLLAAGKVDEAGAAARQWIKDHPTDVTMRAYLAEQSVGRKDYRAAAELLTRALELEPDNGTLLNNLAWALNELDDPKAVELAARAYAQSPTDAFVADTYGWILVQHGDISRGIELLRQAVELQPNNSGMRMRLARALVKAGNRDAARKELEILAKEEGASSMRAQAQQLLKEL